jgi:hypothetical protein
MPAHMKYLKKDKLEDRDFGDFVTRAPAAERQANNVRN